MTSSQGHTRDTEDVAEAIGEETEEPASPEEVLNASDAEDGSEDVCLICSIFWSNS